MHVWTKACQTCLKMLIFASNREQGPSQKLLNKRTTYLFVPNFDTYTQQFSPLVLYSYMGSQPFVGLVNSNHNYIHEVVSICYNYCYYWIVVNTA